MSTSSRYEQYNKGFVAKKLLNFMGFCWENLSVSEPLVNRAIDSLCYIGQKAYGPHGGMYSVIH
jgi:hypothetical protein